jgi:hypothetical protein
MGCAVHYAGSQTPTEAMSAIAHQALEILDRDPAAIHISKSAVARTLQSANTPAPYQVRHFLQRDSTLGLLACSVSGTS